MYVHVCVCAALRLPVSHTQESGFEIHGEMALETREVCYTDWKRRANPRLVLSRDNLTLLLLPPEEEAGEEKKRGGPRRLEVTVSNGVRASVFTDAR